MSLSAALRAAASSEYDFTVVCPLLPMRPYWVNISLPVTHTSQNLLDVPSTNSKWRRPDVAATGTGAGAGVGAGGGAAVAGAFAGFAVRAGAGAGLAVGAATGAAAVTGA